MPHPYILLIFCKCLISILCTFFSWTPSFLVFSFNATVHFAILIYTDMLVHIHASIIHRDPKTEAKIPQQQKSEIARLFCRGGFLCHPSTGVSSSAFVFPLRFLSNPCFGQSKLQAHSTSHHEHTRQLMSVRGWFFFVPPPYIFSQYIPCRAGIMK